MKKILLVILVILLTGCTQETKNSECDGSLGFESCVEPDFDICTDDCINSADKNKYYSFKKAQSMSSLVGTYFSKLEESNDTTFLEDGVLFKTDIIDHMYKGHDTFLYNYMAQVRNDYFGMSTIIELCSNKNIVSGCELNLADNRTITAHFRYGSDAFEVKWLSTIDNSVYQFDSTMLIRANNELDNYDFEYIRTESGSNFDALVNSYAYYTDGVMKVYSHTVDDDENHEYLYYMYDENTGNSAYYLDTGDTYKLDYYIASHNKMYSIDTLSLSHMESYTVTYYSDMQDYMSISVIRNMDETILVREAFNLRYVEGWDSAEPTKDALYLQGDEVDTSIYSLGSFDSGFSGTSPFKLEMQFSYDDFIDNKMIISDDVTFSSVEFDTVKTDVDTIMGDYEEFYTAFGIDFNNGFNNQIASYIDLKQIEND